MAIFCPLRNLRRLPGLLSLPCPPIAWCLITTQITTQWLGVRNLNSETATSLRSSLVGIIAQNSPSAYWTPGWSSSLLSPTAGRIPVTLLLTTILLSHHHHHAEPLPVLFTPGFPVSAQDLGTKRGLCKQKLPAWARSSPLLYC